VPHEDRKTRRKGYYKYLLFGSNSSVKLFVCEKKKIYFWDTAVLASALVCQTDAPLMRY